ncbi:hypothetical protein ACXM0N_18050 [Peribacillus simplex]
MYIISFIESATLDYAALDINEATGTDKPYVWNRCIFFYSYFLFEIPSNVMQEKSGHEMIARILIM